jgi:dethiobiotin synthetase
MSNIVVAGIGTGIGKTFISAILVEALEADYWKPVQAGSLDKSDTDIVKSLVSNEISVFHPEAYRLSQPMSPDASATLDNIRINMNALRLPSARNRLIIEPAGGLMVPLNESELNIDLIKTWDAPVILVSKNYLGSINHTLLSVLALRQNDIPLMGIIFNGVANQASEEIILKHSQTGCIARIAQEIDIRKETVTKYARQLKDSLSTI